jgi:hypothetical protein
MMILVDTSVWIDFFNSHASREAQTLLDLIDQEMEIATCGVVAAEFMQGIRDKTTLKILDKQFRDMQWLTPREPDTYLEAAALYRALRSQGITIRSTIDCLIARLAYENNASLLSRDRDLKMIIDSGMLPLKHL